MKELEDATIQLMEAFGDCTHHSAAIQSVGNTYQPGTEVIEFLCSIDNSVHMLFSPIDFIGFIFELQLTDFKKLLVDEDAKSRAASSSVPQNDPLHKFREAVWVCILRSWTKL